MSDGQPPVEPYVEPAAERRPPPRLADLRPLLVLAIALLLVASVFGVQLIEAREDPTLQVPQEALSDGPAATAPAPTSTD